MEVFFVLTIPLGELVVDVCARGGYWGGLRLRSGLFVEAPEEGDNLLRPSGRCRRGVAGGAGEVEPGAQHLRGSERRHYLRPKVHREVCSAQQERCDGRLWRERWGSLNGWK